MNYNLTVSTYESDNLLFKNITTCKIVDNFLTFHTDNDNIRINRQNFNFIKENLETIFKINLQECVLTLKEVNQNVNIPIEYINYIDANNKILIEYKLISQENPLKIELEIGSEQNEI